MTIVTTSFANDSSVSFGSDKMTSGLLKIQNVDETGNRESEMLVNSLGSASTTIDGDTCALGNFTIC